VGRAICARRLGPDGQTFQMELSWLRCVDKKSPDYVTLNDYSVWHVNY